MCFQKLEFTQSAEEPRSPDGKSLPVDKIWDELDRLIVVNNVVNEEVIDWIEVSWITFGVWLLLCYLNKKTTFLDKDFKKSQQCHSWWVTPYVYLMK